MERLVRVSIIAAFLSALACRSSDSAKTDAAGDPHEAVSGREVPSAHQTAIAANFSAASVGVDSLVILDTLRYRAFLYIASVRAQGTMASFAETGQRIEATPQYLKGASGSIDLGNPRNNRLFALRGAKAGDSLEVKISLLSVGGWVLVDVDAR
jgi:hypothetical protein